MRIYFLIQSLVFVIVILLFIFSFLPEIEKPFSNIFSTQEFEKLKREIINLTIILFAILFGLNFLFYKIDQNLKEEKSKIEKLLKFTLSDENLKKKIEEIEKKQAFYYFLFKPVLAIITILGIFFFSIKFIFPLFRFLGIIE